MDYSKFFIQATSIQQGPYPYQERLATEEWPALLDIPTDMQNEASAYLILI